MYGLFLQINLFKTQVFNSFIMQATIDFKWLKFARNLFYAQFMFFLTFLFSVVAFGILASRTARSTPLNDDDFNNYADDNGGDGKGVYYYPSVQSLSGSTEGRVALGLCPFIVASCFLFLVNELQQLISIGASAYFADNW